MKEYSKRIWYNMHMKGSVKTNAGGIRRIRKSAFETKDKVRR